MDDPGQIPIPGQIPGPSLPEDSPENITRREETVNVGPLTGSVAPPEPPVVPPAVLAAQESENLNLRRRSFRRNLLTLLFLALAAFIVASWILVRVDAPFGTFSTGPQDVVRAQLRALDRGELRPAYDMFSARYRRQVSFDIWHELFVRHWRMFHSEVVRSDELEPSGPGISLEIYLHGKEDDRDYRATFTLIRTDGRWWIDDVHWSEQPEEHDVWHI